MSATQRGENSIVWCTRPIGCGFKRPSHVVPFANALALAIAIATNVACAATPAPGTWRELQSRLLELAPDEREAAIARLIDDRGGTPLIESATRLVFLVRDDSATPPRVVGDFNAWAATPAGIDDSVGTMSRIHGTAWWVLEAAADEDARIEYVVARPDSVRADPLNPRAVLAATGPQSEVRMPGWVPQPEVDDTVPVPAGRVTEWAIDSLALERHLPVWIYLPAGYDDATVRYPTVYVLDGGNYVGPMAVPQVLDRLIAAERIPRLIAVFIPTENRFDEYVNDEQWLTLVTTKLVPSVDASYRTRATSQERVILGSSLGAVGATRLALAQPEIFGRVAAIAPPAESAALVSRLPPLGQPGVGSWFVLGGRYDPLRADAEQLTRALRHAGAPVTAIEVPEGHSRETFRGHLDDALRALLMPGL